MRASESRRRPVTVCRLGDALKRHNEVVYPRDGRRGLATFVGLEHIEPNSGRRSGSITIDLGNLSGRKPTFRRGQIVYGYLRPYLNKVWIAEFDGCSSVDQFAFEVIPDVADPEYVAAFMRSETFLRRSRVVTTTGQLPRIGVEAIAAVPIELPTIVEQKRVVSELKEAEAAVQVAHCGAQARLAAAEALPAAYLREVFEGKASECWPKVLVRDVGQVNGGIQKSPNRAPRVHHYPYLTVRNVQRGSLDLSQVERFEVTEGELERLRLRRGDILVVEGNGSPDQIGRNAIFNLDGTDWIHQNHVIRVRLGGSASDEFVSFYLNSPAGRLQMLDRARSTSGLYTLSVDKIGSIELPLPPPDVQRGIAEHLSRHLTHAEALSAKCRDELSAIDALPAALLRAAFNGDE